MADFRNPISIMMQNKGKIYVKKFIILLFWLGVWQILAMCVDNFLLVVTPLQALRALLTLAGQVEFWRSAFDSLWRIAFGFLLGAVLALLLAAIRRSANTVWQRKSCARSWYSARQYR